MEFSEGIRVADALPSIIKKIEKEIFPTESHDTPDLPLYHYTSPDGFLKIVSTGEIWATHYEHLNDLQEITLGEEVLADEASILKDSCAAYFGKHTLSNFVAILEKARFSKVAVPYLAGFSESGDLLSQWRGYARGGAGFSVGLSNFNLPTENKPGADGAVSLLRCEYDIDSFRARVRQTLGRTVIRAHELAREYSTDDDTLNEISKSCVLALCLHSVLLVPRLKHPAFREECEWRLLVTMKPENSIRCAEYRPGPRGIVPYVSIPLAPKGRKLAIVKVYAGPTQGPTNRTAADVYLQHLGYPKGLVSASKAPYRNH